MSRNHWRRSKRINVTLTSRARAQAALLAQRRGTSASELFRVLLEDEADRIGVDESAVERLRKRFEKEMEQ